MKNETINNLWTEFINDEKYKKYFQLPTILEKFVNDLNKLKNYIDTHNQRPSQNNKDKDIETIGNWLSNSQNNYKKKIHNMKDDRIYKLWTEFINESKYKKYFHEQAKEQKIPRFPAKKPKRKKWN